MQRPDLAPSRVPGQEQHYLQRELAGHRVNIRIARPDLEGERRPAVLAAGQPDLVCGGVERLGSAARTP
jgi:hypothetical protein